MGSQVKGIHGLHDRSLVDVVRLAFDQCGLQKKVLAPVLDLSPSDLSMRVSGYEGRGLHLDHLDLFCRSEEVPVRCVETIADYFETVVDHRHKSVEQLERDVLEKIERNQSELPRLVAELRSLRGMKR